MKSKESLSFSDSSAVKIKGEVEMEQLPNLIVRAFTSNYQPPSWDYSFLLSLKTNFPENGKMTYFEQLKDEVRRILQREREPEAMLSLINVVHQLGLDNHFEEEINNVLSSVLHEIKEKQFVENHLHYTSLLFKLHRQYGFHISQYIFNNFTDGAGNFKESLCTDALGLLSLFDASHMAFEGENIMDNARKFTVQHLNVLKGAMDPNFREMVIQALDFPRHWRLPKLEARKFIEKNEKNADMEPMFLELAKLDFNMVQSIHQREIRALTMWWKDLGLVENLRFIRDRVIECFMFTIGVVSDPDDGYYREGLSKVCCLITTLDDVYDIYGTLDELTLFTNAVERWEISTMEELPPYMKICYSALVNTINKIGSDVQTRQDLVILPYLKNTWIALCNAYLLEAKWYYNNYTPTLKEYLENGWVSVGGPVILYHAFLLSRKDSTKEKLQSLTNSPNFIQSSSLIFRLCNDLSTSSAEIERGDVSKFITCYMKEHGVSEADAREAIRDLLQSTWKKLNSDVANYSPFPRSFGNLATNLAQVSHCVYHNGDGFGAPDQEKISQYKSLFFDPLG